MALNESVLSAENGKTDKSHLFFTEFQPSSELQPWVRSIWMLESRKKLSKSIAMRVIPSGTVDLMINLGSPIGVGGRGSGNFRLSTNRSYAIGPIHPPFLLTFSMKACLIGVRFRFGGAACLINSKLNEKRIQLIDKDHMDFLSECCFEIQRVELMEAKLLALINGRLPPASEPQQLIAMIEKAPGDFRVRDMHRYLGISERQLQRYTLYHWGLSPSKFLRVIRFKNALHHLRRRSLTSWIELAHACGYYDQSHFNRDFKKFTGLPPTLYLREDIKKNMVNFYIRTENYRHFHP